LAVEKIWLLYGAKFGSVDVLVNNASVFETKPFFHVDESYLDRFLDTNLKGTFMISQEIIPQMLKQGYGTVINIGMPFITPARGSAPKAGALAPESSVHALTLQLAAEFGKYNISFNTIMQGINSSSTHAATEKSIAEMNLSNGVGELQDIAQMVYTIAKRNL
jgi:NAD(P)-dependent dehydrogenase (short-subunit alcohol dehydrogenase family)